MSSITKIIDEIEEQKVGASNCRVLLVEGVDDVHAIDTFLTKKFPNWRSEWVLAAAGKKVNVTQILEQKINWVGIIDPDEWSQKIINQQQVKTPNLWALPRYCLENYLCVPEELWNAFPPRQQQKVTAGLAGLESRITADLDNWVCHGVLWSIINPLWEGLRSRGFKEDLLNPDIASDNQKIQDTLTAWHHYLEPTELFRRYQEKLSEVRLLPQEQKLKQWVHGKKFYESVVNVTLNELLGTKAVKNRKQLIFNTCEVSADFDPLWEKMGLS